MASIEGVMHGLYLLWWVQQKQLSPALVAAAIAAGDLAIMLLEIPTGWIADRYGHRASLIVGSLAQVLGMVCCWAGEGLPGLVAANALIALGDAFRSGADHALLYRTRVAIGRESDFQSMQARTEAARLAAMVALVLGGGAIVTAWGFVAGWIAETLLCGVGLLIACALREPPSAGDDATEIDRPRQDHAGAVPLAMLAALALPVALLGAAASTCSFLAQTSGDGNPAGMSALVAVITLAEAIGAMAASRLAAAGPRALVVLAAFGIIAIFAAIAAGFTFVPVAIALACLDGVAHSLRAGAIQRAVPDQVRARAASIASACDQAAHLIALPIAGVWRARRRR